ncbi:hypothetical protein EJB05_45947, partial [Eragrostis curvula]
MDPSSSRRRRDFHGGEDPRTPLLPPATRDWAALPYDVLLAILSRLRQAAVLRGAGLTCTSWRWIALKEPMLWRHIDMAIEEGWSFQEECARRAMARVAVERSAGRCESYCGPADCDFLAYLATRSPSLRNLHITSYFQLHGKEMIPKLPMLERFVISSGEVTPGMLCVLLYHSPHLEQLDAGSCWRMRRGGLVELSVVRTRLERAVKTLKLPPPDRTFIPLEILFP